MNKRDDRVASIQSGARNTAPYTGRSGQSLCIIGSLLLAVPNLTAAETAPLPQRDTYNVYGMPGLIDTPSALMAPDGELITTYSDFAGATRASLSFQIAPRLIGTFRYSSIDQFLSGGASTYDRSFDLRYQLLTEGRIRPAVAIGLQDFIGTSVYSGEYLVATKHLSPRLAVSGGIGWGRFASAGGFTNPLVSISEYFRHRPGGRRGSGGQIETQKFFRGDAALFGGLSYAVNDQLTLKMEYSSDAYDIAATTLNLFERKSPLNFGVDYKWGNSIHLQAHYLHGSEIGFTANLLTNPKRPANNGGAGSAPLPVKPRQHGIEAAQSWPPLVDSSQPVATQLTTLLAAEGIELKAFDINGPQATVKIANKRYGARSEAIGRTMRALTHVLPDSVEHLTVIPIENGIPISKVTLARSDLEELEFAPNGITASFDRAVFDDAAQDRLTYDDTLSGLNWSIKPYVQGSYFDPENPVRFDFGIALAAQYEILPGLFVSGKVQQKLFGNRDESTRSDPSTLPRVRSDSNIYAREALTIPNLSLTYNFRPGTNLYGRVSVGYLESMFGGVSTELLWKPVRSPLALGVEINHVKQRDFDQKFGFRDYEVTMGHASLYYDFAQGYSAKIDAGRYLAGDWGGTVTLSRRFNNGWEVGAYATLTDVSFSDFGEGSFDKGIRVTVPLEHLIGKPSASTRDVLIQPILRDGGAHLSVKDRLHPIVRDYHANEMQGSWGRFWR